MASACAAAEAHWDELLEARESHDKATRLARAGQPAVTRGDDTQVVDVRLAYSSR
ncbi:hypothetical protein OG979_24855 [Actinomadura citrea]|uniref:hypothetical protein n=1 Tax=Actinomadura citrea TaxID=46158 RepID=UPI002E2A58B0|nr:hypothetical protein [Actinomadura citrea]